MSGDEEQQTTPIPIHSDLSPDQYEEWMSIDLNEETLGKMMEEDICVSIVNQGNEEVEDGRVDFSEEDEEH